MTLVKLERTGVSASSSEQLRRSMRQLVGGVSLLTAGAAPRRTGCTVTSVVSLSIEPPRVLVCLNTNASPLPIVLQSRGFAINILRAEQRYLADRFAGRSKEAGEERFSGERWQVFQSGAPNLVSALATIDCELEEDIVRGSHAILIGRVLQARTEEEDSALVYWRGEYGSQEVQRHRSDSAAWSPIL